MNEAFRYNINHAAMYQGTVKAIDSSYMSEKTTKKLNQHFIRLIHSYVSEALCDAAWHHAHAVDKHSEEY